MPKTTKQLKGGATVDKKTYPTPHINAVPEDFAKTVLMPGDPLRAKFIAENYLENARLVNNVRGVQGYTGTYEGVPVSVMGSGMGMPSIGIYSYELYNFFGVKSIIRIGSAGGLREDIKVNSIVAAIGACTNSNFAHSFNLPGTFAPTADFGLLSTCVDTGKELGISVKVGNVLSSDVFYKDENYEFGSGLSNIERWSKMGVIAEEMEAAALYMNAARAGKKALCICTISDNLITGEQLSSEERQTSFDEMIKLVLKTVVNAEKQG